MTTIVFLGAVFVSPPAYSAASNKPLSMYYLSLGDSYAAGLQVGPGPSGGFPALLVADAAPNYRLMLRNFGCSGATTTSLLHVVGCSYPAATNAVAYPTTTQIAAAISFIDTHPGRIGLITVVIGGNNLSDGVSTIPSIQADIVNISAQLRAAAGASIPIIGLTYPNVDLASWLSGPSGEASAAAAATAAQQVVNPALAAGYASSNVTFVNVTVATGGYTPLTRLVNYSTYGEIPYAVEQICILTGMCSDNNNVHPTYAGSKLIARLILRAYLKLFF
ncbi:MAG TPA: SGNH/GDSL hydrolase family protein [Acidimicrobiales bacterium]|nr:SGNH/GDSL hydrolase family protein [Acidimicrobiales bacterium]